MQRLAYIDIMRTLAIFFMIFCHSMIYWSWPDNNQASIYFFANHLIGDFAAPLFLFLVGLSSNFSKSNPIRRGAFIFVIGFIFASLARGPQTMFDWDVLSIIGFSIMFLGIIRHQKDWVLGVLAVFLIGTAPVLRELWGYLAFSGGSAMNAAGTPTFLAGLVIDPIVEYRSNWTLIGIVQGFLAQGFFPIFPWLAFPMIGFCVGRHLNQRIVLSVLGVFLIMGSFFLTPWSFYPENTGMFFLQLGICLLMLTGLQVFCEKLKPAGLFKTANLLSRYSLTIYLVHHFALLWILRAAGGFQVMPLTSLYVGGVLLIALYSLARFWDRFKGKYSLEWFLKQPIFSQEVLPKVLS